MSACCEVAEPHVHSPMGVEVVDTKFAATFFNAANDPGTFSPPTDWTAGTKYTEGDLAIFGSEPDSIIWECLEDTTEIPCEGGAWRQWARKRNWRERWIHFVSYAAGDIVQMHSGTYLCVKDSPAGVCPETSLVSALRTVSTGRWKRLGGMCEKFPPWMPHPTALTIDLDMSQVAMYNPHTGGRAWKLPSEHYVGHEFSSLEGEHSTVRDLFRSHSSTRVTKIYTIREIHLVKHTPLMCPDEPSPTAKNYFGITLGAYIIPPQKYSSGGELLCPGNCSVCTECAEGEDSPDFQDLLPMISPLSGEQFHTVYLQWEAAVAPVILQPKSDSPTIFSSILAFSNIDPHPKYTKLYSASICAAQHGNMMDSSPRAFKRWYIAECVRTGRELPAGDISAEYPAWAEMKMVERRASFAVAERQAKSANDAWIEWLWALRQNTEKLRNHCARVASTHYGADNWINSPKKCPPAHVKWLYSGAVPPARIISLEEVYTDIAEIEQMWLQMKSSIGGLSTYYISTVEKKIHDTQVKLSQYGKKYEKSSRARQASSRRRGK